MNLGSHSTSQNKNHNHRILSLHLLFAKKWTTSKIIILLVGGVEFDMHSPQLEWYMEWIWVLGFLTFCWLHHSVQRQSFTPGGDLYIVTVITDWLSVTWPTRCVWIPIWGITWSNRVVQNYTKEQSWQFNLSKSLNKINLNQHTCMHRACLTWMSQGWHSLVYPWRIRLLLGMMRPGKTTVHTCKIINITAKCYLNITK